jgi:hypothetical protein
MAHNGRGNTQTKCRQMISSTKIGLGLSEHQQALPNERATCCRLLSAVPQFDYMKAPLNRYTFSVKPIREWVESVAEGMTLNLFAGQTRLALNEIRNDLDKDADAGYHKDALQFAQEWEGDRFDTVLLDPPYSYRKSMEMYGGRIASPFRQMKDALVDILKPNGIVITFGYHSCVMGAGRGFAIERILLISHGGAIHDTIATVERMGAAGSVRQAR